MSGMSPDLIEERAALARVRAIGDAHTDEARSASLGVADYLVTADCRIMRMTLGGIVAQTADGTRQLVTSVDVQLAGPAFTAPAERAPTPMEGVMMVATVAAPLRPLLARLLLAVAEPSCD